jgi:hypothetical protein
MTSEVGHNYTVSVVVRFEVFHGGDYEECCRLGCGAV